MKKSHLKSSNDNDVAEVVDADVEGATANEEIKWSLVRPESSGRKVFSKVWSHFKVFNYVIHPDTKGCVACILCSEAKNYDCVISVQRQQHLWLDASYEDSPYQAIQ
jgi:hypothetical protein